MFADLALLPENLSDVYIQSRVLMQFPLCGLFLLSSYHPSFLKHYQKILCLLMLSIIYINYWLIFTCWELAQFTFPYEGTVMYSLFTLFVFRQSFKYGIVFSSLVVIGFALLIISYPIYGAQNSVNLGFVFVGLIVGLMGVKHVEIALKKLSKANIILEKLSQTDPLTEIYNRRTYETRFTEQLCLNKRTGNSICVFIIDLDKFKDYNDGYGHVRGDKVIKLQAEHLTSLFKREADIVARYGGEEFVVVISNVTQEKCIEFAHCIIKQWSLAKVKHGKGKAGDFVTCSVGFHLEHVSKDSNQTQMVKSADKALYQAKEQGRNCFVKSNN
jgi:diguanylate cyclase (GGDEF)-like protein